MVEIKGKNNAQKPNHGGPSWFIEITEEKLIK